MTSCCRQVRALMRKNLINWKRRPKCSFFEVLCPVLTMFVMVFMRHYIHTSTVPYQKLIPELKMPIIPGLAWDGDATKKAPLGSWSTSLIKQRKTQNDLNDFFTYGHYATERGDYSLLEDVRGPFYMVPSDCLKVKSFQLPLVEMPIIAVVGEWNQATYMMQNYLEELISWQKSSIPGSQILNELITKEYGKNATYPEFQFKNFTSKEELFEYTSAENYTFTPGLPGVCYGFQIQEDAESNEWNLELYFNDQSTLGGTSSTGIPDTQVPAYNPLQTTPDVGDYEKYLRRGYATLHNLAANVILKIKTGIDAAGISLLAKPMPAETNISDSFKEVWSKIFPFLIILTFIPPVYNMVSLLVREKETRIKENMRMMGMSSLAYWLSWYVYYTMISTMVVILAWGVLMINCIVYSNPFLVFCFLLLYAQSVLGQIVFLSALFEKSKYAGIIGSLVYFGCSLIGIPVQSPDASTAYKTWLSVFPQVAMQQTCFVMGNLEGAGVGINFENSSETIHNYTFNTGLIMLAVSFLFFTLVGAYLTAVLPKSVGERKSIFLCLSKCCKRRHEQVEQELFSEGAHQMASDDPFELTYIDKQNYEPVPLEVARLELDDQIMKIEDLTKVYPNGFHAVNGINLKMYSGQIFALLGQNGAGKSTMISMLTGLTNRTAGRARLFGSDLFGNMQRARQSMGVCPQHDVLFDLLTPQEHLDIIYDIKGGNKDTKKEELRNLMDDIGIAQDRKKLTHTLSGGNKRKLSVAIALCGKSKLVLLDEPTAGMDLNARRALWDMLKNYRNNRIILLTTHYMDEADVLGDRIAIMTQGSIECLGSSLFLKNRYSAGYKLTMVKRDTKPNKKIQAYLDQNFGTVEKLSEVAQEITFKISYKQASQFQSFFQEFDNKMHEFDILSYGISMTTLEEVFLQVNSDLKQNYGHKLYQFEEEETNEIAEEEQENRHQIAKSSCCKQTGALLTKRFHLYRRDWCGLLCELIIPLLLVLVGLALTQVGWLESSPAFKLETSAYPSPQRMLFNQQNVQQSLKEFTPQEIAQNLPNYEDDYWQISYLDDTDVTYSEFYDNVTAQQHVGDPEPYRFGSFQIYKANKETYDFQVSMFLNSTSSQTVPYFSQFIYESILKTVDPSIKFNTVTAPFPTFYVFEKRSQSTQAIDFDVIISVALSLIPCVTIALIIQERVKQLKHMQLISGVSLTAYWMSNLIADVLKMYIPISLIIGMNAAFDLQYEGVWQLLLLYPVSIVPFTYLTSFLFTRDTTGQILTVFIHFMAGGVLPNAIYFLQNIPWTADLGDKMKWWFIWIPSFCVGEGITFSSTYEELNLARTGLIQAGFDVNMINTNIYAWVNLSSNYAIMLGTAVIYMLILLILEVGLFRCCKDFSFYPIKWAQPNRDPDLDSDVQDEELRLSGQLNQASQQHNNDQESLSADREALVTSTSSAQKDIVRVYNYQKTYNNLFSRHMAVERVSFGLQTGECFALLGVNGAGKSTVFKSLTNDVAPTQGEISIQGINAVKDFGKVKNMIGYCPQNDAIFPLMTVDEHLKMYARVKGISADQQDQVIDKIIERLFLQDHRTKLAKNLSGGNARKLSVAIALLGNPKIILLDEPSCGMDPEARRQMWQFIEKISTHDKKSTVILTTHSMEEAEALSTKMAIMTRGQYGGLFSCFGSSQHIKNKFATGYEIEIKIKKVTNNEQKQFKEEVGVAGVLSERIDLDRAINNLRRSNIDGLILDQIRKDGVGSDLYVEASQNEGEVRLHSLMTFCIIQMCAYNFITSLAKVFERVELLEQCGNFFKLRVPRNNKTIGFLFGMIEQKKFEMKIQEYGICQTSLEQIFQDFALQRRDDQAALTFKLDNLTQGLQLLSQEVEQND